MRGRLGKTVVSLLRCRQAQRIGEESLILLTNSSVEWIRVGVNQLMLAVGEGWIHRPRFEFLVSKLLGIVFGAQYPIYTLYILFVLVYFRQHLLNGPKLIEWYLRCKTIPKALSLDKLLTFVPRVACMHHSIIREPTTFEQNSLPPNHSGGLRVLISILVIWFSLRPSVESVQLILLLLE